MTLGILSESPADEAALEVLLECIPVEGFQREESFSFRSRGWPAVKTITPNVIRRLHYGAVAEGLVIVVDSDDTEPHRPDHEDPDQQGDCRVCEMASVVSDTRRSLTPIPGRSDLVVALGLAVPAIEAWYLCGVDPHVTEATWINARRQGAPPPYDRRSLKKRVYGGTAYPTISKAEEAATRLCGDLPRLEQDFPAGFGMFATQVRGW